MFDVDWAAVLDGDGSVCYLDGRQRMKGWPTYLVGFVVVLRIVLEHLRLLLVVECPWQIICTEVLPPFFAINKPTASNGVSTPRKRSCWPILSGLLEALDTVPDATHICFDCSTLNFLALRNLSRVKVSRRSLHPACSSICLN